MQTNPGSRLSGKPARIHRYVSMVSKLQPSEREKKVADNLLTEQTDSGVGSIRKPTRPPDRGDTPGAVELVTAPQSTVQPVKNLGAKPPPETVEVVILRDNLFVGSIGRVCVRGDVVKVTIDEAKRAINERKKRHPFDPPIMAYGRELPPEREHVDLRHGPMVRVIARRDGNAAYLKFGRPGETYEEPLRFAATDQAMQGVEILDELTPQDQAFAELVLYAPESSYLPFLR
jgi:hypothetical protein